MLSYQNGNKINFLRICIEMIHVILMISVVLGTFWGKVFLMNKCTFNWFQSSDLKWLGEGRRGITANILLKPWHFFSSRNPTGSYSFDVHSPFERGRLWEEEDSVRPKSETHREAGSLRHRWPSPEWGGWLVSVPMITHLLKPWLSYLSGSHPCSVRGADTRYIFVNRMASIRATGDD